MTTEQDLDELGLAVPGQWQEVSSGELRLHDFCAYRSGSYWYVYHHLDPRLRGSGKEPSLAFLNLRENLIPNHPALVAEIDEILGQTPLQLRKRIESLEATVKSLEAAVEELVGIIRKARMTGHI